MQWSNWCHRSQLLCQVIHKHIKLVCCCTHTLCKPVVKGWQQWHYGFDAITLWSFHEQRVSMDQETLIYDRIFGDPFELQHTIRCLYHTLLGYNLLLQFVTLNMFALEAKFPTHLTWNTTATIAVFRWQIPFKEQRDLQFEMKRRVLARYFRELIAHISSTKAINLAKWSLLNCSGIVYKEGGKQLAIRCNVRNQEPDTLTCLFLHQDLPFASG